MLDYDATAFISPQLLPNLVSWIRQAAPESSGAKRIEDLKKLTESCRNSFTQLAGGFR